MIKNLSNKLKFAVEDIHLLEDSSIDTSQFSLLRVDAFATGKSLHDTYVTEETLRKTAKTILQKPFVFVIDERFSDLGTHNSKEVAAGFVPHNSRLDFKQLEDGRVMLCVDVLIWRRYSNNLIEYFQRDGGRKGVSVEIEIFESRENSSNGLLEIVDFCYNAITGLGDMIQSAIPNAEAVMVFSKEFAEAKNGYELSSKYDEVDFTIPPQIKKNANKALEAKKGSSVALAMARYLIANEKITPERIYQINKFFKNKNLKEMDAIALGLYGGKQGYTWAKDLGDKINSIDSKRLSYYADEENYENNQLTEQENTSVEDNYLGLEKEDTTKMAKTKDEQEAPVEGSELDMAADPKPEETSEESPKAQEENKFSYASVFGSEEKFAEMFAEEEDDAEDEKAVFAQAREEFGNGTNTAVMMKGMYAKMCKMARKMAKMEEDSKVYMSENEDLKNRFAEIERSQKEFAVNSVLKELSESVIVPDETLAEMKTESEKYSLAELDSWKNYAKALCFDFKSKAPKEKGEEVVTYAFPWTNIKIEDSDNVWASLNK